MAPFAQKRMLAHQLPANKMGRPSEYKPEHCQAVIEYMGQGYSLSAFAGSIKVARDTVYQWMSEHKDFSDAVSRARMTRVTALEKKLLNARYGAQANTSIFALRNADPHEWRDIRNVQHEHNVTVAAMTDDQLLAIARGHGDAPMIDVTPAKKR